MTDQEAPLIAVRGAYGLYFTYGPPKYGEHPNFEKDVNLSRVMAFSDDGKLFAWVNGKDINVMSVPTFQVLYKFARPKTSFLKFSPLGNYLASWEPYTVNKDTSQGIPNLHIWNIKTGECVRSLFQKKQHNWCPQWTSDEAVCARIVNNEVHFFENSDFGNISKKIHMFKVQDFAISPGPPPYHAVIYVPGSKGQPSFVRVFCYPKFEGNASAIANKSFYKAEKVDFFWSGNGRALLILTSSEVDRSGSSYYGEQSLHFVGMDGNTSIIKLPKDGPIYSLEWNPNSSEFCIVYGYMPAKATIFNKKCEQVFDFGTGPRNLVYYNVHGNLLVLAGFGNLRGNVEVWDVKAKKEVAKFQAQDTTHLSWCPNGQHILTSTTSPRLRVGNGYRVWHYTGSLLFEFSLDIDEELWEVQWQPFPPGSFPETKVVYKAVPSIQSSQPETSKQIYRPPAARGQPSTFKLREDELPSNMKQEQTNAKPSKNKRKKEARKAKREREAGEAEKELPVEAPKTEQHAPIVPDTSVFLSFSGSSVFTGDPEKDKKIRGIMKKLEQIVKLKEQQQSGKILEVNQLEKIKREDALLNELQQLQM